MKTKENNPRLMLDYSAITLLPVDIALSNKCASIQKTLSLEKNLPFKKNPKANMEDWHSFSAASDYTELLKIRCGKKYLEIACKDNLNGLLFSSRYSEEHNNNKIIPLYHLRKAVFTKTITTYQLFGYIHEIKNPPLKKLDDLNFLWFVVQTLLFHEHLLNSEQYRHNLFLGWEHGGPLLIQRIGNKWHASDDSGYPEKSFQSKDEVLFFPVMK